MLEMRKINNQEDFAKQDTSSSLNNSTLSLHIAAYENLNEASNECFEEERLKKKKEKYGLIKRCTNTRQIFAGSALIIQNPFEFPRQQEEKTHESEVTQFKASQSLLNPNSSESKLLLVKT
uniref:Uncharacterized protein n=1 Tax=Panagrolaimus sp. ES5 TaxID=591445 RepID=A0AC34FAB3_9BILA